MRRLLFILLAFCVCGVMWGVEPALPAQGAVYRGMDMRAARAYCDSAPLHGPEGIYAWPEHDALVLVRAQSGRRTSPTYEIITIEARDLLLAPGQVVGALTPTAAPDQWHLYLYSSINTQGLTKLKHQAAKYTASTGVFSFKAKNTRLSLNPLAIIPRLRSLLRLHPEDPVRELPEGLTRVYPLPAAPAVGFPLYF